MKALILAAGLGSRLAPLTNHTPKALVPFLNKPMIDYAVEKLFNFGIKKIIVNLHHFGEELKQYLLNNNTFNIKYYFSDESKLLLDTGGAIKKAKSFLKTSENFIVHNVDVFSNIDLNKMYDYHIKSNNLVSLAVKQRISGRYLLFNSKQLLCGWKNINTNETKLVKRTSIYTEQLAFSGIQILNSKIFEKMPNQEKFSAIDLYLHLASNNKLGAYIHNNDFWFDLGSIDKIKTAEIFVQNQNL